MRTTLAVVLFASFLAACGGGGGSNGSDARPIGAACTATEAGYGTPTTAMPFASRDMATMPGNVYGGALINADATPDAIFLNLYKGFGTYMTGEITAKSVTIAGDETEGVSCGACLEVDTDIDDQGKTKDIYLASGGTINITAVSPMLTFTVSSASFRHVDVVDPQTFETKDSADGCTTSVASLSFTATVEDGGSGSGSAALVEAGTHSHPQRLRLIPVATAH